jgi:hypothetical protein
MSKKIDDILHPVDNMDTMGQIKNLAGDSPNHAFEQRVTEAASWIAECLTKSYEAIRELDARIDALESRQ